MITKIIKCGMLMFVKVVKGALLPISGVHYQDRVIVWIPGSKHEYSFSLLLGPDRDDPESNLSLH